MEQAQHLAVPHLDRDTERQVGVGTNVAILLPLLDERISGHGLNPEPLA